MTLDIDLRQSREQLWANLHEMTANEIRRAADKDKVVSKWLKAQDLEVIDRF